jgi:hypothetical protein
MKDVEVSGMPTENTKEINPDRHQIQHETEEFELTSDSHRRKANTRRLRAVSAGAAATGALAVGTLAVGALAIGALAIGALAVGRLFVGRAKIRRLEIDELVVHKLRLTESLETADAASQNKD